MDVQLVVSLNLAVVAILSAVSHSIWSAVAVLWRCRHWAKG